MIISSRYGVFMLAIAATCVFIETFNRQFIADPPRVSHCGTSWNDRSGTEKAAFLNECPDWTGQWSRIKTCNQEADAKRLKGAPRESFVGRCWKGAGEASDAGIKRIGAPARA